MTKAELQTTIENKSGFVAIVSDNPAPDNLVGAKQKRYFLIEVENQDGTRGIMNVTYIHDTENDLAYFYNVEPLSFEKEYKTTEQQTQDALEAYCSDNFHAYEIKQVNVEKRWAIVTSYVLSAGQFTKTENIVYKQGTNPLTHAPIV